MVYIKPSKPLSSILNSGTLQNKTSLHGILRDVKKSAAGLGKDKQMQVAKIIKKLNDDPNAVVTNAMSKTAVHALGSAGHLQEKYQKNAGGAIAKVQQTKAAPPASPGTSAASGAEAQEPVLSDSEKRRREMKKKMQMWALARERRSEEEKHAKGTKFGLNAWQQAAASIGKSIEAKERERKKKAEDDVPKRAVDLMID